MVVVLVVDPIVIVLAIVTKDVVKEMSVMVPVTTSKIQSLYEFYKNMVVTCTHRI